MTDYSKIPLLVPPGRSCNIRTWDKLDVEIWLKGFLDPEEEPEVFEAIKEYNVDGKMLHTIQHMTIQQVREYRYFGIYIPVLISILEHAGMVANVYDYERRVMYDAPKGEW